MGSSPNFRGASALLRGSSRAFSPKRAKRDAPSVCLTGEGSVTPRPQAPPRWDKVRFLSVLYPKVSSTFSKVAGSRGGAPDAFRTASRSEAFRAQPAEGGLLARDERGTLYPVKRFFRVNCRDAARGGFLQVKKPPCRKKSTQFLAYPASPDYEYRFKDFPCIFHNYVLL